MAKWAPIYLSYLKIEALVFIRFQHLLPSFSFLNSEDKENTIIKGFFSKFSVTIFVLERHIFLPQKTKHCKGSTRGFVNV